MENASIDFEEKQNYQRIFIKMLTVKWNCILNAQKLIV